MFLLNNLNTLVFLTTTETLTRFSELIRIWFRTLFGCDFRIWFSGFDSDLVFGIDSELGFQIWFSELVFGFHSELVFGFDSGSTRI